jgi:hypothetical protein
MNWLIEILGGANAPQVVFFVGLVLFVSAAVGLRGTVKDLTLDLTRPSNRILTLLRSASSSTAAGDRP